MQAVRNDGNGPRVITWRNAINRTLRGCLGRGNFLFFILSDYHEKLGCVWRGMNDEDVNKSESGK